MYQQSFTFWSLLATEKAQLPGGFALANLELPLLLANAAWYPRVGQLKTVAEWYARRKLPAALIVAGRKDKQLERTLHEGPFTLEQTFGFVQFRPQTPSTAIVEQVSWLQSRVSANILADFYGKNEWNLELAKTLSKTIQADDRIQNYIAYDSGPSRAMITFTEKPFHVAMLFSSNLSLSNRLENDAKNIGCTAYVLQPIKQSEQLHPDYKLERWSID